MNELDRVNKIIEDSRGAKLAQLSFCSTRVVCDGELVYAGDKETAKMIHSELCGIIDRRDNPRSKEEQLRLYRQMKKSWRK